MLHESQLLHALVCCCSCDAANDLRGCSTLRRDTVMTASSRAGVAAIILQQQLAAGCLPLAAAAFDIAASGCRAVDKAAGDIWNPPAAVPAAVYNALRKPGVHGGTASRLA